MAPKEQHVTVKLTESARNELNIRLRAEQHFPRIDAEITGGCGLSVKFMLVFDEPRRNDKVVDCGGIPIRIDRFTARYLREEVQVNYTAESGFYAAERFTSSGCAAE
ncbi:iron-sulfur cluster biosynthesis family protein [Bacillus badius]|uniref:iron-sulfur cluster biosynthesis family protein n=1 Tax=Bacillus badius TaxID=1455 RepID=UPI001CC11155|nr:iron-sulfur cluster biosynthesis family protein [Bacillus badius]UAT30684.1 iron-sulfur cluster biosynthesis family protein [Bacillus badius]